MHSSAQNTGSSDTLCMQSASPTIPWSLYDEMVLGASMAEARHALKPQTTAGSLHNAGSANSVSRHSSEISAMSGNSSMSGKSSSPGRRVMAAVEQFKQSTMMVTVPLSAARASVKAKLQQVKCHIHDKLARPSVIDGTSMHHSASMHHSTAIQQSTEVAAIAVMVRDRLISAQVGEHSGALLYARMRLDGLLQSAKHSGWDESTRMMVKTARDLCDVQNDASLTQESVSHVVVMNSCTAAALTMAELLTHCGDAPQD